MAEDPFDDILNLEEKFYHEGYRQGQEDGIKAGRIEGRSFGMEKGFEKFVESGRLYGKAIVWANRQPLRSEEAGLSTAAGSQASAPAPTETPQSAQDIASQSQPQLPRLPANPRLEKHITTLYALVESESLSTENTDEAVNDFDDRLKRAQGKAKIIEKMLGEDAARTKVPESGA